MQFWGKWCSTDWSMLFIYIPSIYWKKGPHCRHPDVGGPYFACKLGLSINFRCAFGRFPKRTIKHFFLLVSMIRYFQLQSGKQRLPMIFVVKTKLKTIGTKAQNAVKPTHTQTHINIYIYMVTTFKYVEGGPDREAPEIVWNTSSYI